MLTSTEISIDVRRPGVMPRVYAIQGEKNSRMIAYTLHENGENWAVDGATATVRFRRGDGTGGSYTAPDEGGPELSVLANVVLVPLTQAVCAKAGPVTLVVELSKDGTLIATWPTVVTVAANPGCSLVPEPEDEEAHTDCVKSVNGIPPDEDGNVEIKTASEQPVHMDISGFYDGLIVLDYEDGGKMNIDVTFDANGNPVKFSNGTEDFTITWPAEEAASE